ncbi:hypothetical protein N7457_006992 [Penicillium paradoxum]|uniref:uncharacterized protein n=1 Tax=Penicillium paradoxum TaxID=176176 RepID=UPI0025468DA5|nr:uncharacterized protein N7457_006992 [Penicillium paradoxum]KAJ5779272.1 hypothetical protein N7457_006992 [Penicillium paradoxum]
MLSLSEDSNSDRNRVTTSAAAFITARGPAIHVGLAGSSHYSEEESRFLPMDSYSSLEQLLKHYLPENLGINFENNAERLEQISERLINAQKAFTDRDNRWWYSLWRNIGEEKYALQGWIALIPNEYGLAIVKTGLAVVFKLAERSANRAAKIHRVFSSIRDALTHADPTKRSFRGNKDVAEMADNLTQSIVDSIEDMILLTTKNKSSWRRKLSHLPKFSQKITPPDIDGILEKVEKSTEEFERVVGLVRDRTIEVTGYMTHAMTSQLSVVQDDIHGARDTLERLIEKEDIRYQDSTKLCKILCSVLHQIAERENTLQNTQIQARNGLMEVLKQSQSEQ